MKFEIAIPNEIIERTVCVGAFRRDGKYGFHLFDGDLDDSEPIYEKIFGEELSDQKSADIVFAEVVRQITAAILSEEE